MTSVSEILHGTVQEFFSSGCTEFCSEGQKRSCDLFSPLLKKVKEQPKLFWPRSHGREGRSYNSSCTYCQPQLIVLAVYYPSLKRSYSMHPVLGSSLADRHPLQQLALLCSGGVMFHAFGTVKLCYSSVPDFQLQVHPCH